MNLTKWGGGEQTFSGTTNRVNLVTVKEGTLSFNGNWNNTNPFNVGGQTTNIATLKVLGGVFQITTADAVIGDTTIGLTGQVIQTSGDMSSPRAIRLSTHSVNTPTNTWASYTLSGGSISLTSTSDSYLLVGRNGYGEFNQSGGTVTVARTRTSVADAALLLGTWGGNGYYTLSGGTLNVTNGGFGTIIAYSAPSTGSLTITNTGWANLLSVKLVSRAISPLLYQRDCV
jgi:hypothetical protein